MLHDASGILSHNQLRQREDEDPQAEFTEMCRFRSLRRLLCIITRGCKLSIGRLVIVGLF